MYRSAGAALVRCPTCKREQLLEWKAGDQPIYIEDCCGDTMHQVTHNDGRTPLEQPCPAGCCKATPGPPQQELPAAPTQS